jgi:hypothetical protein
VEPILSRSARRGCSLANTAAGRSPMTEAEAHAALAAFDAVGEVEQWIAEQWWEPLPCGGWRVRGLLHGRWRFRLEPVRHARDLGMRLDRNQHTARVIACRGFG